MANSGQVISFWPLLKILAPLMGLVLLAAIVRALTDAKKPKGRRTNRRSGGRDDARAPSPTPNPPSDWTLAALRQVEWKRFEALTTEFFKAIGFRAHMTRVGADGGVDVVLYRAGEEKPIGIAQCKAWTSYTVGIRHVRELYGVMAAEHVEHGVFVTTSAFTEEAREFANGKNLELVDGEKLVHFIRQLDPARQQNLFNMVFAGDFSTPTCPSCDIKMVLRTARKGNDTGSQFWGCPNYPRCRQTIKLPTSKTDA